MSEPTPEGDQEIDLRPAAERAKADDTISVARSDEPKGSAWLDAPGVDEDGTGKRPTSTRLAMWTPDMDRSAPDDTVIYEVPPTPRMFARAAVPRPLVSQKREPCDHCGGAGFMPGINDFLRESIALIGDQGDEVVKAFYRRLFTAAPEVAKLFPGNPVEGDLGSDHRGAKQREKLLDALLALADLYDPGDGDRMQRLDRALGSYGRSHAAFSRPDGSVQGATWEEYGAVKDALFATLVQAAGNAWKAEYTAAWSQAYDYAAAVMVAEQYRSGYSAPRFPRA